MRVAKRDPPKGVALSKVLLALAGLARAQRAYKLARFAYSRLQVGLQGGSIGHSTGPTRQRQRCPFCKLPVAQRPGTELGRVHVE